MADETPYCMVMTTLAGEALAEALAREIVQARLGACVQVQGIKSFYRWKNETRGEHECLLLIKTRKALYRPLEDFIRAHHPYETPEIVQLPITAGSADYLQWLASETGG
ncbi:divalent-cation tolerance protein CutA [Polaromonas sp.]|uniref:divalent-cation tolerance protein CutA n=1 Tax=Polaromonas sp. TaxID=1869339 RepID=UPI00286C9BF8|nr:divalent-cation tolerance protein CutA [Polaromonas sp.]